MNLQRITFEHGLYLLAFAIALGVRIFNLGAAPLSEFEAGWALQAWQVSRGEQVISQSGPGYISLTGLLFYLFSSSNFLARFWPALAGSLLVGLPFFFRNKLGQQAAIVLAFGLAIDPGLVSLSRLAGGPMLALAFGLLSLGLFYARLPILAGFSLGLAIMGGPAVLIGALGIGLTWVFTRLWFPKDATGLDEGLEESKKPIQIWKPLLISTGITIILIATIFLRDPQGLSALFGTIPYTLNSIFLASEIPVSRVLLAPMVYSPLAVFFAAFTVVRFFRNNCALPHWCIIWLFTALALALIFPGRQVSYTGWVLIPLWILAAIEIARHFEINDGEKLPASGQALLLILLLGLGWFNLSGLSNFDGNIQTYRLRLAVIGGTIVLGVVTTLLVALGWSPVVAKRGLAWGVGAALGLFTLANMWGVSQLRANGEHELWNPPPATRQADLLIKTLGDFSSWHVGHRQKLDILITTPNASLRWLLRDWPSAVFVDSIASNQVPSAIISPVQQAEPKLGVGYRGQEFSWAIYPAWEKSLPENWTRWLVFRSSPQTVEHVILWVRTDVFPSGSLEFIRDDVPYPEFEPSVGDDEEVVPGRQLIE